MKTWTRRQMLKLSASGAGLWVGFAAGFGAYLLERSRSPAVADRKKIPTRVLGPSSTAGHRLRDGFKFPAPSAESKTDVLILGGGISGLSAGWRLQKNGGPDFQILELESEVGGNSRSGENQVSKYPWGAHYLTMLNEDAKDARELYTDLGIITGQKEGRDIYNDDFLCEAPQERLFIYDKWQADLLPKTGASSKELAEFESFFHHLDDWRVRKGHDGRFAFTIPLDLSSRDAAILALDQETMAEYMRRQGWTSPSLHWYVDYCCRDDYGTSHSQVSAWAGLHYFCSRRSHSDDGSGVLTWPEGNGWVVHRLRERLADHITTDAMAIRVEQDASGVIVDSWSEKDQAITRWRAKKVVIAMPRFIAAHLGNELTQTQRPHVNDLSYAPWVVANLTLKHLPANPTMPTGAAQAPLSWDNVIYESASLGYVVATHQIPQIHTGETVFTYYRPLDHKSPADARREAMATSADQWRHMILDDLQVAHPDLSELVTSIDVWVWGHAMVRPTPGFIWGATREAMRKPLGHIHFAHSDMSGISIFEEAHYHGVRAADEVSRA